MIRPNVEQIFQLADGSLKVNAPVLAKRTPMASWIQFNRIQFNFLPLNLAH